MAEWSQRGFSLQHYRALLAEANIALYVGDGRRAYELVSGRYRALEKSFLLRVQYVRADAYFLLGRCALAAGRVREAERFARKLDRERMDWTRTLASFVWAGVARARGRREEALAHLRAAAERADASDMHLYAAVARMRLGEGGVDAVKPPLASGAGIDVASARGRDWMTAQGIACPDRIASMLAPGTGRME